MPPTEREGDTRPGSRREASGLPAPPPCAPRPSRTALGRRGEDLAARLLERRGFVVLERNFRVRGGELDLVCRDGRVLVFVEVRSWRAAGAFGSAVESIRRSKQVRMRHAARRWLCDRDARAAAYRFDVVAVQTDASGGCLAIEHLEDVLD